MGGHPGSKREPTRGHADSGQHVGETRLRHPAAIEPPGLPSLVEPEKGMMHHARVAGQKTPQPDPSVRLQRQPDDKFRYTSAPPDRADWVPHRDHEIRRPEQPSRSPLR